VIDMTEAERFVAGQRAVEFALAKRLIRPAPALGVGLMALGGLWRGWPGVVGAGLGMAVVVGNYLLSGWLMSRAARIGFAAFQAVALGGFLIRMGLIAGSMYLIVAMFPVDRMAFGVSVAVGYLALLVVEAVAISKRAPGEGPR
jgi:hypothetical protein